MTTKAETFTTEVLDVAFGFLHKRDDKFSQPGNFNVTVLVDETLRRQLEEAAQSCGGGKINGLGTNKDNLPTLKVRTKFPEDARSFPCVDANAKPTDAVAFGGDKVRLRIRPRYVSKDGSVSFDLQGCQIIEKNDNFEGGGKTGGFGSVDGGFDGSAYVPPTTSGDDNSDDPIPF